MSTVNRIACFVAWTALVASSFAALPIGGSGADARETSSAAQPSQLQAQNAADLKPVLKASQPSITAANTSSRTPGWLKLAAAPSSSASPKLTEIADSIQVRFQGYKELNGDYRLNEDETISIPGVGRLSVAGMTASDLEAALAKQILGSTGRLAPVSVEVSAYRHVFVDGMVEKPGSFQWRRGLTVIKAISISGGIYRPRANMLLSQSPLIQRGRLDIARLKLAQALVRQARVATELTEQTLIKTPERLIGIFGRHRANELITTEQQILDHRRTAIKARLSALEAQKQSIDTEIQRLDVLSNSMASRIGSYKKLLVKMRRSYRAGGVSNRRLFEVEQRLGELEEKLANSKVQLVRAQSSKQLLESKRSEVKEQRREELIELDIKTKTLIEASQIEYEMALDTLRTASGGATVGESTDSTSANLTYEIIRRKGDTEQRINAERLDLLMPGDTLVVRRSSTAPDTATPQRTLNRPRRSSAPQKKEQNGRASQENGRRSITQGTRPLRSKLIERGDITRPANVRAPLTR